MKVYFIDNEMDIVIQQTLNNIQSVQIRVFRVVRVPIN